MISIESLDTTATKNERIVIYPASRSLSAKEIMEITEKMYEFLSTWKAHGKTLFSAFKIDYKQFIIISIDEDKEPASGCSIDALGAFMRKIDTDYHLDLFNRMKATYIEKGELKTLPLREFKSQLKAGFFADDVQVFDFSKENFQEFAQHFLLPLKESWARHFIA